MEKVENKTIEDFPSATLFFDDLSEIVAIFVGSCKRIELKAGDYRITDPKELDELAKKFQKGRFGAIYLQGYDPYIQLNLATRVSAYISEDSLEQRGIIAKCRDIVARGKKLNPFWLLNAATNVPTLIAAWQLLSKEYLVGLLLLGLSFALIPVSVTYGMKNRVIVHTHTRASVTTFFQRKKDDIVLAIVSAAIGALVTYLATKYTS